MTDPNNAPAGWYDDGSGGQRYWDGNQWTDQTASGATITATAPQAPTTADTGPKPTATKPHPLSFVALAIAVIGFIFACIPGALIAGWVLLPIAFILSLVALFLQGKKWPAITALVLSVVGTVVGVIVFTSVVSSSFNEAFGGTETTVAPPADAGEEAEEAPAAEDAPEDTAEAGSRENPVPLGSLISGGEYDVTINSVNLNATDAVLAANQFNEAPADGFVYALVNATITYTGEESGFAAFVGIDYVSSTGEVITPADNFAVAPEPTIGLDEMYNGGTVTGNIVLSVPAGDAGLVRVRPGVVADNVFVAVQ